MRFTFAFIAAGLVALSGCLAEDDSAFDNPRSEGVSNGIVFGITQRTDRATGKTLTTAGHEYLVVDGRITGSGPLSWDRQSWPDGWCRRFTTARDEAHQQTNERGRAHFAGGRLGDTGMVLEAHGADATFEGAAFEPAQPILFDVESGFGLPPFDPVEVQAPNVALPLTSPSFDRDVMNIARDRDLRVEWTPGSDPRSRVMIAFDTNDRADHVRCFVREGDGAAAVRAEHFQDLRPGTMTVASHRSTVVSPGDGWLVDVIAMVVLREQRYVVR